MMRIGDIEYLPEGLSRGDEISVPTLPDLEGPSKSELEVGCFVASTGLATCLRKTSYETPEQFGLSRRGFRTLLNLPTFPFRQLQKWRHGWLRNDVGD
jgi:hypothetical protein